jgi:hypothetical protein
LAQSFGGGLLPNPENDWLKTEREIEKWQLKYHIMGENARCKTMTSISKGGFYTVGTEHILGNASLSFILMNNEHKILSD